MLLMFAGGVMSVVTMAAVCGFVVAERVLPAGPWAAKLPGVAIIAWGVLLLAIA
jgi:predicted metal-binding membrane protein